MLPPRLSIVGVRVRETWMSGAQHPKSNLNQVEETWEAVFNTPYPSGAFVDSGSLFVE